MKFRIIRIILTVVLLLSIKLLKAQQLVVAPYTENTQVGIKAGTMVGIETRDGYELGVFYQEDISLSVSGEADMPRFYEKKFYGAFFAAEIVRRKMYNLKFNVRTGTVNGTYLAITPSLTGNLHLTRFISLQGGVGIRSFRPTAIAGLRIRI